MRNTSLLALGFASAVALTAAPSFAATTHARIDASRSAYAAQRLNANAQDQQARQCWIRGEMGENPNGNFGYWGSCSVHGALPGR